MLKVQLCQKGVLILADQNKSVLLNLNKKKRLGAVIWFGQPEWRQFCLPSSEKKGPSTFSTNWKIYKKWEKKTFFFNFWKKIKFCTSIVGKNSNHPHSFDVW